jgi:uncharacterized protein with PhoU and TrkA domain
MALSVAQYDRLESAITKGRRLVIMRRGSEYLVIPERLRVIAGREVIIARHPSTGQRLDLYVDDVDSIEVV